MQIIPSFSFLGSLLKYISGLAVVEQELKLDLCVEMWFGALLVYSVLLYFSQFDLLQCNLQSSFFLGFLVLVDIQTTSAEYNMMWCIFSYSSLEAVQASSTCLVWLATHPAKGELAQAQYQLLTRVQVKVCSDTCKGLALTNWKIATPCQYLYHTDCHGDST